MKDECDSKEGKLSFTGLDTAESNLILCKDDANERNESLLSKSQMQLFLCKGKPAKTLKLYQMLQWM